MNDLQPNESEKLFLSLAYNRFYDLYKEVMEDSFWDKEGIYRFSKVTAGFTVYCEVLNYEPIQWVIDHLRKLAHPWKPKSGAIFLNLLET